MAEAKQLFKNILQLQLTAPAKIQREGKRNGIAVVDMRKGVCIQGISHMAADHARETVQREHGSLAGTAAGDDKIRRAAVQKDRRTDPVLYISQLSRVVRRVHTVIKHFMAHGLHDLLQCLINERVLCCLAVFIDKCDLHFLPPVCVDGAGSKPCLCFLCDVITILYNGFKKYNARIIRPCYHGSRVRSPAGFHS